MAESESGADKSEDPTSKRLEESRTKGQVARSRELNTVVVTMAGIAGLLIYGGDFGLALLQLMRGNFALPREVLLDDGSMALYLLASGKLVLEAFLPLLIILLIAAVLGPIAVGVTKLVTGDARLSILILVLFFVGGMLLLSRVPAPKT